MSAGRLRADPRPSAPSAVGLSGSSPQPTIPGSSRTLRRVSAFLVVPLLLAAGCSRSPVIALSNQSSQTLSNVVVSGSGFSERIGNLPGGGRRELPVQPRGETGVRLEFDAGPRHVDTGAQGYFEAGGGYRVSVVVGTNLDVAVTAELRKY